MGIRDKQDETVDEYTSIMSEIHKLLIEVREDVYDIFEELNLDAAFFDIDIDLSVKVDHYIAKVKDNQKGLNAGDV